jgi:hypothetical protein
LTQVCISVVLVVRMRLSVISSMGSVAWSLASGLSVLVTHSNPYCQRVVDLGEYRAYT